jgi:hypothetical protein
MARCDAQYVAGKPKRSDNSTNAGKAPQVGKLADELTHVGKATGSRRTASSPRAQQEIPPAFRRQVLRRDQHCCVFPGCRHATFVDVHHIEPRAEGGTHDPENLVTVCSAHHRAIHRGQVSVTGTASALRIGHADGTAYGGKVVPSQVDLRARAFRALRRLGFGEREVRRALQGAPPVPTVEALVRAALHALTAGALAQAS